MLGRLRPNLTYANVMSTLAVFLLLGGVAWAAATLPENSVGTKQLKKNAVTSPKVKNGSLRAQDFKAGQLHAGPRGAKGNTGPRGPSDVYATSPSGQTVPTTKTTVASLDLPAGRYVLLATAALNNNSSSTDETAYCNIYNHDDVEVAAGVVTVDHAYDYSDTVSLSTVVTHAGGAPALFTCQSSKGENIEVNQIHFQAIRVGTLTSQP